VLESRQSFGNIDKFAMFEKLCRVVEESDCELHERLKEEITGHIEFLQKKFQQYFSEPK